MTVRRSDAFILVALFLARYGRKGEASTPLPPARLDTDSWRQAYAGFFHGLAMGRSLRFFHHSLKLTRDQFDSHVDSGRRGLWVGDDPKPLPKRDAIILATWRSRSEDELWQAIRSFWESGDIPVPPLVLDDIEVETEQTSEEEVSFGLEGKSRAIVSRVRERSPRLRVAALRIHGYLCQVCGFDFEGKYGAWGRGFIEVHHIQELAGAPAEGVEVDPATDLAVVCSNCHRMIHRRPGCALPLAELREIIADASKSDS